MLGFSKPDHRTVIAVDVGSSSVGVTVVVIHADNQPEIIWDHREYCLIHDAATPAVQLRQIKTALTNAFLEFAQTGLAALKNSGFSTTITEVQAVYAAPWSYTITKTITLKDDHPFTVTEEMLLELTKSAKKQSELVFASDKLASALGLDLTHEDVIDITLNEYSVTEPVGQEGRQLSLTHLETAIAKEVTETLIDMVYKFFPKAAITQYSFMYAFYLTLRHLHPHTAEICLIDVTGEATEIGIVRDDVLRHVTYAPVGMYSIARQLASATGVPKEEAHGYLKDDPADLVQRLPARTREAVAETFADYEDTISALFQRTGDKLTTPRTFFLHTDAGTQQFFVTHLEAAARKATGGECAIHPITAKILGITAKEDTALILSVNFLAQKKQYFRLLPHIE